MVVLFIRTQGNILGVNLKSDKENTMLKMTSELIKIAAAGGGLIIDADKRMTLELVKIAAAANNKIIIKNINNRMTSELVKIAAAGKGNVIFDLT